MQTVYTDVAGIATVAAVVCAAVCLFLMNFSKSGRTVDESRSWLKRIVICWAALYDIGCDCNVSGKRLFHKACLRDDLKKRKSRSSPGIKGGYL